MVFERPHNFKLEFLYSASNKEILFYFIMNFLIKNFLQFHNSQRIKYNGQYKRRKAPKTANPYALTETEKCVSWFVGTWNFVGILVANNEQKLIPNVDWVTERVYMEQKNAIG